MNCRAFKYIIFVHLIEATLFYLYNQDQASQEYPKT